VLLVDGKPSRDDPHWRSTLTVCWIPICLPKINATFPHLTKGAYVCLDSEVKLWVLNQNVAVEKGLGTVGWTEQASGLYFYSTLPPSLALGGETVPLCNGVVVGVFGLAMWLETGGMVASDE